MTRPKTRAECAHGLRPCPWIGCRWHLYLGEPAGYCERYQRGKAPDVIRRTWPAELEPEELPATCALDLADLGGMTLHEVGEYMNLSKERVRQIEKKAFIKVRSELKRMERRGEI